MKRMGILIIVAAMLLVVLGACANPQGNPTAQYVPPDPKTTAAPAGWEQRWADTLAAAKKEGAVFIYSYQGAETRQALGAAFKNKYGINLEFTTGTDAEILAKITNERNANQHLVDVVFLAAMAHIQTLKPNGVNTSWEGRLILPEVIDDKKWVGGTFPWFDKDHTVVAPIASYFSYMLINTDLVKPGEVTAYQDLLKPSLKGKMTMFDPTIPSPTQTFSNYVVPRMMGVDSGKRYLQALAAQDLSYTRDPRLLVESTAKSKYLVAIGVTPSIVITFVKEGAPLAFVRPKEGGLLAGGPNLMSLASGSPNPNAATIFVNWLLTDEGQKILGDYQGYPSLRIGVPYGGPDQFPVVRPDDKTIASDEAFYVEGLKTANWAKDIFGPVVGK